MSSAVLRPTSAALLALTFCLLPAIPARAESPADVPKVEVQIDANAHVAIADRKNEFTMATVRVGRYGTGTERRPVYEPVCSKTPCALQLPEGEHWLAVDHGDSVVEADGPIGIYGPAKVTGDYVSRTPIRLAGLFILAGSLGGAIALSVASFRHTATAQGDVDGGRLGAAGGLGLVGGLLGVALMSVNDAVSFSVAPLTLGGPPGSRREGGAAPAGLTLTGTF